jgi:hypothetical protein
MWNEKFLYQSFCSVFLRILSKLKSEKIVPILRHISKSVPNDKIAIFDILSYVDK